MKKVNMQKYGLFIVLFIVFNSDIVFAQQDRILTLKTKLESLVIESPGLTANVDVNVSNTSLPGFLQAIAHANNINLNVNPELEQFSITNNFFNATVADVLLFVCKEYDLDIGFTGILFLFLNIKKE